MKYVIIEDRLLAAWSGKVLKCQNWEYCIANINPIINKNMPECIQLYLTIPMSLDSRISLVLLWTPSQKFLEDGIWSTSLNPLMELTCWGSMKICNENLLEDGISLISCWLYKVIHEKYEALLNGHDNVSDILKFPQRSRNRQWLYSSLNQAFKMF